MDISPGKLLKVEENLNRLGLKSVSTIVLDATRLPAEYEGKFDRVLLDAPCSNTGVLSRRPEARWRISEEDITTLQALQTELLRAAVRATRPGGKLVYSTCSIEPEENQDVIRAILESESSVELEEERQTFPGERGGDGTYMARLRRVD